LKLTLLLASVLFLFGISMPLLTITKLLIFDNTVSVLSGVSELFEARHYLLFSLIVAFSIVLPVLKIVVIYLALSVMHESPIKYAKYLRWIHAYGRWSMLDVMVVAILIVTVKLGAIASVEVHEGLYVFGASVLLIMVITHFVAGMAKELTE
jgi:paraquat-inducible protein A